MAWWNTNQHWPKLKTNKCQQNCLLALLAQDRLRPSKWLGGGLMDTSSESRIEADDPGLHMIKGSLGITMSLRQAHWTAAAAKTSAARAAFQWVSVLSLLGLLRCVLSIAKQHQAHSLIEEPSNGNSSWWPPNLWQERWWRPISRPQCEMFVRHHVQLNDPL